MTPSPCLPAVGTSQHLHAKSSTPPARAACVDSESSIPDQPGRLDPGTRQYKFRKSLVIPKLQLLHPAGYPSPHAQA
eukprot:1140914-Pelagomonas_calceolata.AAC.3